MEAIRVDDIIEKAEAYWKAEWDEAGYLEIYNLSSDNLSSLKKKIKAKDRLTNIPDSLVLESYLKMIGLLFQGDLGQSNAEIAIIVTANREKANTGHSYSPKFVKIVCERLSRFIIP